MQAGGFTSCIPEKAIKARGRAGDAGSPPQSNVLLGFLTFMLKRGYVSGRPELTGMAVCGIFGPQAKESALSSPVFPRV